MSFLPHRPRLVRASPGARSRPAGSPRWCLWGDPKGRAGCTLCGGFVLLLNHDGPGSIWWSIERKNNQPHPARKLWKCFFSPPLTQARLLAPFEMWGKPEWPDRAVPHTDPRYCRCSEQRSSAPGASSHTSLMRVYLRHPAYLTFSFWETLKSIWVSHFSV